MDKALTNKWLRERHSTFPDQFDPDRKILDEEIKEILENAIWAPTHKLTQPWQFVVYGPDTVTRFIDQLKDAYSAGKSEDEISEAKLMKYDKRKKQVSHIIVVNMIRDREERVPEIEEICAVSCAIQNIYLSLASYDIGGYLSSGLIAHEKLSTFLELGPKDKCLGYFLLGRIKSDFVPPERKREGLEEKMKWVG